MITSKGCDKWDRRFLELADHIASWSRDPSTKVGACIIDNKRHVVSVGYNGFPRGVLDLDERYDNRETKLMFVAHAERNALDNAHSDVSGCTLYTTLFPCNECAKSIIQRGINRIVAYEDERVTKHFNWEVTKMMFQETNIIVDFYKR